MNINKFFEDLAANTSRNYKIEQLKKNQNNVILKKVIFLTLDPFTQFYIRKIPQYQTRLDLPFVDLGWALSELNKLSNRTHTGNAGIQHLKSILESMDQDDAKVIERIIQKDLKCGVSTATANAVWKDLVADYPCMLCSPYEDKLIDKIKFPAYVQLKMDGMRFNAIVKDGKVEFRTRNGKQIDLLGNLESEFLQLANNENLVFDGELLVMEGDKYADRQTGNGILNKAVKNTISDEEAAKIHATIWDKVEYDAFVKGVYKTPYVERFGSLSMMDLPSKIKLVNSNVVSNIDEARKIFNDYLSEGQEGIILKDFNGIWENKRTKSQIKFKAELDCDLIITGVEAGTGKYERMLGAIICQSSDGVIEVSVGSGFTDEQRKTLLEEKLLGKIVAVKYNARIKNKQNKESLFLPIFLELRLDKSEADSSEVIK
jgi:ATP-dependent DNA ligase